ncbi:MAG: DNA repair protein RecN [Caldilineaceae bacterium]|nr:DNA repair protein RecN [Caldilineaceae bacterium]
MLTELHIRNFAIIDDLQLTFEAGLNILTGETGAGKSIIIDALGLLLGDRATAEWVRAGSDLAEIEATFRLPPNGEIAAEIQQLLEAQGLDEPGDADWLLLSREVRLNGRNICRVNGRMANLQTLADLAGQLIDVHGQGEHLNLLRPRTHLRLLDRYAGLQSLLATVGAEVTRLRTVRAELQRLRQDARTIAQRLDLLSFRLMRSPRPTPAGEEADLEGERRRLSNAEALLKLAQSAGLILTEGEGELPGALDQISEAVGRMERLARIDPDMDPLANDAQGLLEQFADLARQLEDYADQLEFNPERLTEVEDRLELIANLKRKYGDTIEQILIFGARAQAELDELSNWEVRTAGLEQEEDALLHKIGALAAELSEQRTVAGEKLARQVEVELADLRMERAQFGVSMTQSLREDGVYLADGRRVAFSSSGIDQVEFLVSANPGEPLKPMVKVASGGETARLMLALKSVLTRADATPTLIFDEIDQGIGGRVGGVVGEKLWNLTGLGAPSSASDDAGMHQVLCITHLPQLAAFGDQHFTVNKQVTFTGGQERTTTVVKQLDREERVLELVQMLGAESAAGRQSVEEMLTAVASVKTRDALVSAT